MKFFISLVLGLRVGSAVTRRVNLSESNLGVGCEQYLMRIKRTILVEVHQVLGPVIGLTNYCFLAFILLANILALDSMLSLMVFSFKYFSEARQNRKQLATIPAIYNFLTTLFLSMNRTKLRLNPSYLATALEPFSLNFQAIFSNLSQLSIRTTACYFFIIKIQYYPAMKALLTLLWVLFCSVESKTYTCAFHEYAHSNHYQSKKGSAAHQLSQHFHNRQQSREGTRRVLYGAGRPPMRITLNTDDFDTIKASAHGEPLTTIQNLNFIKKAMLVTKTFYQSRLRVSSEASIPIPATCYDFDPPQTDVNNSIAASDLHIYVRYITDSQTSYGATGVSCNWNPTSVNVDATLRAGRPIVGRIKFNTNKLVDTKSSLTNRLFASITATALHETMHILGFDPNLYSAYLDSSTGLNYTQVIQSRVLNAQRTGGPNNLMITPAVSAWALSHFGCSNVTGMPLENQDGTGVGAHWERVTMYDEIMTGTELGAQKSFTALTFALLKDMGWYGVDDSFNDTTNYGYQKGCSFFFDACYGSSSFPKYFCNMGSYVNVTQCSSTFTGKSVCSNQSALMADGCGMFKEYFHCVDPASVGDFYQSYTLEAFGTNSFCFKGTIANAGIANTYRSRCYPYVCNFTTSTITLTVGPYTVNCFSNEQGSTKTVTGMQGSVECPVFSDFCTHARKICPNWCSGNGFCTRGVCNCYSDGSVVYSGEDCSISTCVAANTYYYAQSRSCLVSCPSGYYANARSKACLKCDSSCNQCRDQSTICTSCISTPSNPQYYYEAINICVSQCPSVTFLRVDTCVLCDSGAGCATCSGSSTFCTSCINPAHYLNQLGNCGTTCSVAPYTLFDDINRRCQQSCPNTLYLNNGHCIKCTPNYKVVDVQSNTCVGSCSSGYYTDTPNAVCGRCNETCKECVDKYAENCTSCWSNSTLKYEHLKMCVRECPDGFYTDTLNGKCETCLISLHCATCELVNSTVECKTCKYTYYLQPNNTCLTACDPTFYPNQWNHTCDPCHADCRDCTGPYQSTCLNCHSPKYFLSNSTGGYCLSLCPSTGYVTFLSTTCLACHPTCLTCINETSVGCVTCRSGLYLENNKCRYVCSPNMYPNPTSKECLMCDSKCKYCFGSSVDNCTQCQVGYVLDNFTCASSCPSGQLPNSFKVCEKTVFQTWVPGMAAVLVLLIVSLN